MLLHDFMLILQPIHFSGSSHEHLRSSDPQLVLTEKVSEVSGESPINLLFYYSYKCVKTSPM